MINKRQIFTVLFVVFIFSGLTGNVWGVSTEEETLPSNTPPEVKNLMNYIQARSGCSLGEATLVTTMLADQLSTTENAAFLMYMMAPDNHTNVTGLNPNYTYRDYFENNPRYKAIKERLDGDIERYGHMSHDEKLAYAKHTDMDFVEVFNELTESGDLEKTLYVLENSNIGTLNDEIDDLAKPTSNIQKGVKNANKIKDIMSNSAENISLAMLDYDCLKIDGKLNNSIDLNASKNSLLNQQAKLNKTYDNIQRISYGLGFTGDLLAVLGSSIAYLGSLAVPISVPAIIVGLVIMAIGIIFLGFGHGHIINMRNKIKDAIDDLQIVIDAYGVS